MRKLARLKRIMGVSLMILSFLIAQIPVEVVAETSDDFVIVDGVLVDYIGGGGDVVIPDTVRAIDTGAFFYNVSDDSNAHVGNKVTSITVPASVTEIGCSRSNSSGPYDSVMHQFLNLGNLQMIYVDENNPVYSSMDGILYNKEKTILYQMPQAYKHTSTEWSIPEGVEESDMLWLTGIETLYVPSTYKFIDFFYKEAPDLKEVKVSSENPEYTSVDGVVYDKNITKLISWPTQKTFNGFPASVSAVGKYAFANCELVEMTEIPTQIVMIEDSGFACVKFPETLTIPNTVKSLGMRALSGVGSKIVILEEGITEIPQYCFSECQNLEEVYVPKSVTVTNFDTCFYYSEPIIKCYADSKAHEDARICNLQFELIDTEEDESEDEISDKVATIHNNHDTLTETDLISAIVTNSVKEPILKISNSQNDMLSAYYQSKEGEYDVYYMRIDLVDENGDAIIHGECKYTIPFPEGWGSDPKKYYEIDIVKDINGLLVYGEGHEIVRENGRTFVKFPVYSSGSSSYDIAIMWDKSGYDSVDKEQERKQEAIIQNSNNQIFNSSLIAATVIGATKEATLKIGENSQCTIKDYITANDIVANDKEFDCLDMTIELVDSEGNPITEFTSCTITIPLLSEWQDKEGTFWVATMKADGTFEKISSNVVDVNGTKCIQFTTNHFSEYAIVLESDKSIEQSNDSIDDTNNGNSSNNDTGTDANNGNSSNDSTNNNSNSNNANGNVDNNTNSNASDNNTNNNTNSGSSINNNANSNTGQQSNITGGVQNTVNNASGSNSSTGNVSANQNSTKVESDLSYMPKTGVDDLANLKLPLAYDMYPLYWTNQ